MLCRQLLQMASDRRKGVVAIIPARGRSKGIPRKNIVLLRGRPLIAYTIGAARACPWVERVIVSTEDKEIAAVAREWGAEVPLLRPAELAADHVSLDSVVDHALAWLDQEDGLRNDAVALMYPSAPFRSWRIMEQACRPVVEGRCQAVGFFSRWVLEPETLAVMDTDGQVRLPLRERREVYQSSGSIFCWRRSWTGLGWWSVVVEKPWFHMEIDTMRDLEEAERMLREGHWSWEMLHADERVSVA